MNKSVTRAYSLYTSGQKYNNSLTPNYYDMVELNLNYARGYHWVGMESSKYPKPVVNIEGRAVNIFNSIINTSNIDITLEPMVTADTDETVLATKVLNQVLNNLLDNPKFRYLKRSATREAMIAGDIAAHFRFDTDKEALGTVGDEKGEICVELVDGSNTYLGDTNHGEMDKQPYVLLAGRDSIGSLKSESSEPDKIKPDSDTTYQIGANSDYENEAEEDVKKATYLILYERNKDGTVGVSKSTESASVFDTVDTKRKKYPVAWLRYQEERNEYHGQSLLTSMHPLQDYINTALSLLMWHQLTTAFGKPVYNADYLNGWSSEPGAAIPLKDLPSNVSIRSIVDNISPAPMSGQLIQSIELAVNYLKESLALTDTLLGNVRPENYGAISVITKNSTMPLENFKSNIVKWYYDMVNIIIEMVAEHYGTRSIVIRDQGNKEVVEFDFNILKNIRFDVNIKIGESGIFSEISTIQTLDNLVSAGLIDAIEYFERYPDGIIPNKEGLIEAKKMLMQQQSDLRAQVLAELSPEDRAKFDALPPQEQEALIQEFTSGQQATNAEGNVTQDNARPYEPVRTL